MRRPVAQDLGAGLRETVFAHITGQSHASKPLHSWAILVIIRQRQ
jgi:hypothetical protein